MWYNVKEAENSGTTDLGDYLMRRLSVGILAHVDAGKTTLSEAMLYKSGSIRTLGRVDKKNAFLDTESLERERGITIFSKQAVMEFGDTIITLLDTPGHVDFSAEMERTLWVMDYAILVISGADGIQSHTMTLWRLLERYNIPVFLFVNKMDHSGAEKERLLEELQKNLGEGCIDFTETESIQFMEQVAVCDERLLEQYLKNDTITKEHIANLIQNRMIFPCFFGSALKINGIQEFMEGFVRFTMPYSSQCGMEANVSMGLSTGQSRQTFGAKVFKIARDAQGNRLTYLKVTSGTLRVRDVVSGKEYHSLNNFEEKEWSEKISQIRIYSGNHYEVVPEMENGGICAVTGLTKTSPGMGLGVENNAEIPMLEPVLTYTVEHPEDVDDITLLEKLGELCEEFPELSVSWQEETSAIQVRLMGEVQIDVLTRTIYERFGIAVSFGEGDIVYKETICDLVEGIGHFEPLKHYAEVHLKMEPGERGSGIQILAECSEDLLDKNWQRLIMTHLEEKQHVGVLTGSALTDVRITVVAGKAHTKHTEGGDFRQATYRAVRQGLMQAKSRLLEPYYAFCLEVPISFVGRAMTDIENMSGNVGPPVTDGEMAELNGTVPVSTMHDYQIAVNSYTKGRGRLFCSFKGYAPCHNEEEVIAQFGYNPDEDVDNPSSSVFCAHGSGYIVPWHEVPEHMHVESVIEEKNTALQETPVYVNKTCSMENYIDEDQIETILNRTYHANEKPEKHIYKKQKHRSDITYKGKNGPRFKEKYLIVDGYNIVHAWEELSCLIEDNLEGARMRLLDLLSNYQAFVKVKTIVVFDAYKVKGNIGEMFDYHNIHVVYTKEAETADSYIEKLTHRISKDYQVTVATSDGLIQLITRGQNCIIMSARELRHEIERVNEKIREYIGN